ncbi:hypothetical protein EJB05_31920 [Eragrostis curvula]|uniref:UspA domain-containing protein n=1 Tax=Eragrostis curvula TaxID=38414 RepID=A0A5J9UFC6_9POAL|nr:hypothetical protein EJB05_31920 [Eragrostis curvula]
MESQRVVVVVEDAAAARAALRWAVGNFIRGGDSITLLHVCPPARSRLRRRSLRLGGFQLALAFKDLCNGIAELAPNAINNPPRDVAVALSIAFVISGVTNAIDLLMADDDGGDRRCVQAKVEIVVTEGELGETVVATVNKLGATTLVVGLHDKSFLYRAPSPYARVRSLGCRVLAVRQHATARGGFLNAELTQIETVSLHVPPPKIPFPMFTLPLGVIWRRGSKRRK